MCQQVEIFENQINQYKQQQSNVKSSYSIVKVLKMLFKKQQQHKRSHSLTKKQQQQHHFIHRSLESLESLENFRNSQAEEQFYEEIENNTANEKLCDLLDEKPEDIYVPVRFARTSAGTFFWTTNLQPVCSSIMPQTANDFDSYADRESLKPAYCYRNIEQQQQQQQPQSHYQHYQHFHMQDRWAQA